jgi:hypothetical protein
VLVTLALGAFFGLVVWQPELFAAVLGREDAGHISQHFRQEHHRVHDLTFSFLLGTAVVGMLAQLRAPAKNLASQLMALAPFVGLVLASVLTNLAVLSVPWVVVGSFTLLSATLHPTGRDLYGSLRLARTNRLMLGLVAIGAVPLLAFAFTNLGLQRTAADDHAALGHYGFLAAFGFTVVGVGLLASLQPEGWRLTAWVAGLLPAVLGIASIVFPGAASSLGIGWAVVAIGWGATFVVAAELTRNALTSSRSPSVTEAITAPTAGTVTPSPGTSVWAIASGSIIIVLVLLFVAMHLSGGSGGHLQP